MCYGGCDDMVRSTSLCLDDLIDQLPEYRMEPLTPEELQAGIPIEVTGRLKGIFLSMLSEAFTSTVLNTILGEAQEQLRQCQPD
ncbi:hypothetical protein [Enterocloster clostridioformis]|jgi:hypothetical protein|uniref:Uncharacterized protein n=3 Tax=Enterocloster clostridioformis TaxID=1531 RepID=A0A174LPW3_9FIRM|nr:hypothetical protein [Enterocloster clostridioformis]CUX70555.1 hypothetical protein BN3589_01231 [Clostridium sp. C105KSO14]MCA5580231.1 hypothetical protein [Enterocloster clostridioformis]MCD7870903.1 hypothetical protein [Enterocloster clostridioformis]MCI7610235.1 hypothetical protein [Enterocloster clostridioformis]MDU1962335.1 hypothetical protein [Enterocloster clostridioformis]